ncbi:MAG: LysR family transcriptional regulator [Lachnospiraceae bacterium]|nr:LysR family transcriptional regulator [Lachnospiraceae bacterium]
MELKEFTYVSTLAQCGSFTKASARLFITQPALSNYISKVEDEIGVKLFDRSSSPLVLTYAGQQYLKRARVILNQLEDMNREMRDITHHKTGRLRIGFPSERIVYMLPLVLIPFKAQYPGIDVEVMSGPGNRLVESLREGNVDFVFLPAWHSYKDIARTKIAEEELVLVAARNYLGQEHFLDREAGVVNWRSVAGLPLVTLNKGHALRASVEVLYRNTGVKPNIVFESHSNMLSYRLAAQGLGITIIPEITLELMKGSMEAEVFHLSEMPVTWEVYALHREGCYIGEVEQALLDMTRREMAAHRTIKSGYQPYS